MTTSQNALNLLSIYNNSDSDSENEIPGPRVSVKRCLKDDGNSSVKCFKTERLPVPSILQPVSEKNDNFSESSDHGGRIRSFPHERGNWSTYVYIPYKCSDVILEDIIKDIIEKCKLFVTLQASDHLHISLTKTVILRHHWIESFTKTVGEHLVDIPWFVILFDKLKVYCNEERTRTFIGFQIENGHDNLVNLVKILDSCLREFNLPEFYKDPSFHMSLVWCVGDFEKSLNNIIHELNEIFYEYTNNPNWGINVKNLMCKTGNKYFNFNLKHGTQYVNSEDMFK